MKNLAISDNQAITSRFGEAIWLTSLITPNNPDVQLLHHKLTDGITSVDERAIALWRYTAGIPYRARIKSSINISGRKYSQNDTWLYPAETIRLAPAGNCATKSFLLTSLLRNVLGPSEAYCVMGHVTLNGIGAHAWVEANLYGQTYVLEGTQPRLENALVPSRLADAYQAVLYFNDKSVYTVTGARATAEILEEPFGYCAVPFLHDYLCQRCIELRG